MNLVSKKKIALPLAALGAAVAMSAMIPSAAQARPIEHRYETQISYRHGGDFDFRGLKSRIWEGVRRGDLTRSEARRLSSRVDALEERAEDYSLHGFTRWERRDLNDRYRALSARIYGERHDRDYRGGHWR
jgi:hypothetical protein